MKQNINDWWRNHIPDDQLVFRNSLEEQCIFVRDKLLGLFLDVTSDLDKYETYSDEWNEAFEKSFPSVIGEHYSKSVKLPVMELDFSKIGIKVVLRCNIYDWCISIESKNAITCDFLGLITDKQGYFEGFPKNRIYAGYSKHNNKNFSLCLYDQYEVYTFMRILRRWVDTDLLKQEIL